MMLFKKIAFLVLLGGVNLFLFQNCSKWQGNVAIQQASTDLNLKPIDGADGGSAVEVITDHGGPSVEPVENGGGSSSGGVISSWGEAVETSPDSGTTSSGDTSSSSGVTDGGNAKTANGETIEQNDDPKPPSITTVLDPDAFRRRCFDALAAKFGSGLGLFKNYTVVELDGNQTTFNGGQYLFVNYNATPVSIGNEIHINGGKNIFCGNFSLNEVEVDGGHTGFYAEAIGSNAANSIVDEVDANGGAKLRFINTIHGE